MVPSIRMVRSTEPQMVVRTSCSPIRAAVLKVKGERLGEWD